jgi:hypothetical protein
MTIKSTPIKPSTFITGFSFFTGACIAGESIPHFHYTGSSSRKHAILQAVKVFAVNWRDKFAGCKAEKHAGREIVFADTVAKLEVLVEHGSECERNRLGWTC